MTGTRDRGGGRGTGGIAELKCYVIIILFENINGRQRVGLTVWGKSKWKTEKTDFMFSRAVSDGLANSINCAYVQKFMDF